MPFLWHQNVAKTLHFYRSLIKGIYNDVCMQGGIKIKASLEHQIALRRPCLWRAKNEK